MKKSLLLLLKGRQKQIQLIASKIKRKNYNLYVIISSNIDNFFKKNLEKIYSIPFTNKLKEKIITDFKKSLVKKLVNTSGKARIGGLSKTKSSFFIKKNIRYPNTNYYDVLNIKKNDIIMLLNASYTFDKTRANNNKSELNFWFTILINGKNTHTVCAKQFIIFYKQNNIVCLND